MSLGDRLGIGEIERRFGLFRSGPARVEQGPGRAVGQQDLFGQGLAKILVHEAVNSRGRSERCQIRGGRTKDVGRRESSPPPTSYHLRPHPTATYPSTELHVLLIHSFASSP